MKAKTSSLSGWQKHKFGIIPGRGWYTCDSTPLHYCQTYKPIFERRSYCRLTRYLPDYDQTTERVCMWAEQRTDLNWTLSITPESTFVIICIFIIPRVILITSASPVERNLTAWKKDEKNWQTFVAYQGVVLLLFEFIHLLCLSLSLIPRSMSMFTSRSHILFFTKTWR